MTIYTCHDMIIPWQLASRAHVAVCRFPYEDAKRIEETIPGAKLNGVIHSHHDMNCDFSSEDEEYINKNNEISILARHAFQFTANARSRTACGRIAMAEAKVVPLTRDMFWVFQSLETDLFSRIKTVKKENKSDDTIWEYVYPTKDIAMESILDKILVTQSDGTAKTYTWKGDENVISSKHRTDNGKSNTTKGSDSCTATT